MTRSRIGLPYLISPICRKGVVKRMQQDIDQDTETHLLNLTSMAAVADYVGLINAGWFPIFPDPGDNAILSSVLNLRPTYQTGLEQGSTVAP